MFELRPNDTLDLSAGVVLTLALALGVYLYVVPSIFLAADFVLATVIAIVLRFCPLKITTITPGSAVDAEDQDYHKAA